MSKPEELKPAVRIDGARRTDLAGLRARQEAARKAKLSAPPVEDTRVADAWEREAAREGAAKRATVHNRRMTKLRAQDGLKEGATITTVKVRISEHRYDKQAIRARPGTFEWRYGRNKQDALFHAGNHLARIWEQAGTAAACSPSLDGASGAGWRGLPDGRVAAIDCLNAATIDLGKLPMSRLVDYCVLGLTSTEIAKKHGQKERDMAAVLNQDLRDCAIHLLYL